jgi:SAM-dependent methyltransferase
MPYKVYLWGAIDPIGWSQVIWRIGGENASAAEMCRGETIHPVMFRYLPPDGLVIDAGCGTAKWPIYLRAHGYHCLGLEISIEACQHARREDPAVPLILADTRSAPLHDACADALISLGVIEHDEAGPAAGLRELRRLLKPGGVLIVSVPFNNLFRRLIVNRWMSFMVRRRRRAGVHLGFNEYRFRRRELRRHLRDAGFETVAEFPDDYQPPRVMGLWVDFDNLVFSPLRETPTLFVMPGWRGFLARLALDYVPWLVSGGVAMVARAR